MEWPIENTAMCLVIYITMAVLFILYILGLFDLSDLIVIILFGSYISNRCYYFSDCN